MTKISAEDKRSSIRIGISSCLLGAKVRFDAGHKRDNYITDILGRFFTFVSVCPELEVGMGVPREAVRLTGTPENPSMIVVKSGRDWTEAMNRYARDRVRRPDLQGICGYILKKDSPSCGMERVSLYGLAGAPSRQGRGLFARTLMETFPHLPVEEEGRLNDARLRDNFITRVFACHRLMPLFDGPFRRGAVVEFHSREKYLLLAHSPGHYQSLGKLVAAIKEHPPSEFRDKYRDQLMEALKIRTTTAKNVNVLTHILGFLKTYLDAADKKYILEAIEQYRRELVPLVVPITLLNLYIRKFGVAYIADQTYLQPHPQELMLRNRV